MKFTFVFPTRGRLEKLKRTLESIDDTCSDLSKVQVVIAVDKDERDLYAIETNPPLEVLVCERQDRFSSYFNKLLPLVKGDAVWVWSDENVMSTKNWDRVIEKAVRKSKFKDVWFAAPCTFYVKKDGRIAGSLNPVTRKMFTCFPVISRKACEALGFIITPKLRYWGADLYMNMLFDKVGRVIKLEEKVGVLTEESIMNDERLSVYQQDLDRLIEQNLAKLNDKDSNIVEYDMREEIMRLREAMVIPRFYRL